VFAGLALVIRLLALFVDQASNPMFWPANGALVVAMLILPRRSCWLALLLCFGINLALNVFSRYSDFGSVLFSLLNILVSYMVAVLTRWLCGAKTDLSRLPRLAMFVPIVFLSTAIEAAIGELILPPTPSFWGILHDWQQWTLCDGLGLLLATPAILLPLKNDRNAESYSATPGERWALLLGAAALTLVAFLRPYNAFFLLIFPLLVLTAFRAGPAWVQGSILVTAIVSSGLTVHGLGPFAHLGLGNPMRAQDMLQIFLVSIFFTSVPATNALGDKSRATRRLLHMKSLIEHRATHDALTGLVNRNLFKRRLKTLLDAGMPCAVLFVDLDRFKHVNDTMGHQAGDALLIAFSQRLLDVAGDTMLASRFGGDEFAILVPGQVSEADQEKLCRRINDVARMPFPLDRGTAYVTASVGLAPPPGPGDTGPGADVGEWMRRADIALYAVKTAGRDAYRVFSDDLARAADDRAAIEADLRLALEGEGQLQLHYQAKVDADHTIRGVEALLRWHHPTRGWVPPNQVIPVAEETGLIIPLGNWILREALAFSVRWPQLNVAVNVSPLQLHHPRFVTELLQAYHAAPVSFGRLELEVTETALMDDINMVSGRLATLRAEGIRVALDDFGTGYSSLRHLHRCGVDRVKIDQSFVHGLDGSTEAAAIIKAIIQLGHAMDLQVTAEGVETDTQRRFLLEAGADELQGYLFSKPLDEAAFIKLMRDWRSAAGVSHPRKYAVLNGGLDQKQVGD
jgi:diguanylate cyclase (GGDEF)-like protein